MPLLFSYGTLQNDQVQLETFGRLLSGKNDFLPNYKLDFVEITDAEVLRKSGEKFHPIIRFSGNAQHKVEGVLFEVTDEEILAADEYEVADYRRIETVFESGNVGFIYVER